MRRSVLAVLLVAWLARPLLADPAAAKGEWTILVYMTADCDLESFGVLDLVEMASVPHADSVRVIVQCDRAEEDDPEAGYSGEELGSLGNFTGTKRLLLGHDRVEELADLGEVNMGDPSAFIDFVSWGFKTYPAKRTAVLFWDHGSGWPGYGGDDSHDHDMLDLPELVKALPEALQRGGVDRIDLIGYDCCLMASLEVMRAVQPFARTFLGSEELEPGDGWHYQTWLPAVMSKPDLDAASLAKVICNSYQAFFEKHKDPQMRAEGRNLTLSVVDLDRVPAVVSSVEELGGALAGRLREDEGALWDIVARARHRTEEYGKSEDGGSEHIDLGHLARNLKGHGADSAADRVIRAVDDAVLHRIGGRNRAHGRGISIYFPTVPADDGGDDLLGPYASASCGENWSAMLRTFVEMSLEDVTPPLIGDLAVSNTTLGAGEHIDLTARLQGDDIAEVYYVLAEPVGDEAVIMGMVPIPVDGDELAARFDGTWMAIGDAKKQLAAPVVSFEVIDEEGEAYVVGIPAIYRTPSGRREFEVVLYFEVDWDENDDFVGELIYAFRDGPSGPSEIDLKSGGKILPLYVVVDEKGDIEQRRVEEVEALVIDEGGLDLVEIDLPPGKYQVGFVAEDLSGNLGEAIVDVEITE